MTYAVLPLAVLAAGFLLIAVLIGGSSGIKYGPFATEVVRQVTFPRMNLQILGYLTGITLGPFHLRLIYDVAAPGPSLIVAEALGLIMAVFGSIGFYLAIRRASLLGFAATFFFIFCLPFLQFIPFATWSLASERFLFMPIFGAALAAACLLNSLRRAQRYGIAIVLIAVLTGITFHQAKKWATWKVLIQDAATLSPGAYDAQANFIDSVLLPERRFQEAKDAAEQVHWLVGQEVLSLYVEAWEAANSRDWARAQEEATQLTYLVDPMSQLKASHLMGILAERRGDYLAAIRHYYFAELSSISTEKKEMAKGALARMRTHYENRLQTLKEILDANPDDLETEGELANLQMELFLLDEASQTYRSILSRHPSLAAAHYNLGLTYLRQWRFHDAVQELRRAIEKGVSTAAAWNNLGRAHQNAGNLQLAEHAFRTAMQLDPPDCFAAINLGRQYLALNKLESARKVFLALRQMSCASELKDLVDLYLREIEQAFRL